MAWSDPEIEAVARRKLDEMSKPALLEAAMVMFKDLEASKREADVRLMLLTALLMGEAAVDEDGAVHVDSKACEAAEEACKAGQVHRSRRENGTIVLRLAEAEA